MFSSRPAKLDGSLPLKSAGFAGERAPRTVSQTIKILKRPFKIALEEGLIGPNPVAAAGFGATKLALPDSIHDRLLEQFPVQAESLAKELGFTADCFTNREARFLCVLNRRSTLKGSLRQRTK